MKFEVNEAWWDRALRAAAGVALIAWGWSAQSWWGLIGVLLLFTAATGHCSIYSPFGIDTRKLFRKG